MPAALSSQLSETQQAVIREFEQSRSIRDMISTPGWEVFLGLKNKRIEQIKAQFMTATLDKEALWAAQVRLKGIVEFVDALIETVNQAVEQLEPEAMKRIISSAIVNPEDLEGDLL